MRKFRFALVLLTVFASSAQHSYAAKSCADYFMKRAVINIQVKENKNGVSVRVFQNDNWVGQLLNQTVKLFEKTLRIQDLGQAILRLQNSLDLSQPYFSQLIQSFEVQAQRYGESLAHPPGQPVIYYANHPLSGMDAFAIGAEIEKVRPDLKVLAASFLETLPGFKEQAFIVSLYGTPEAKAHNKRVMEAVSEHLKAGNSLLIFPSGSVSAWSETQQAYANDVIWRSGILKFASQSPQMRLQPLFVWGEPSEAYLKLRQKSVDLSNAYVFRELANQIGTTVEFTAGSWISYSKLKDLPEQTQLDYLRAKLYSLGEDYYKKAVYPKVVHPGSPGKPGLVTETEYQTWMQLEGSASQNRE